MFLTGELSGNSREALHSGDALPHRAPLGHVVRISVRGPASEAKENFGIDTQGIETWKARYLAREQLLPQLLNSHDFSPNPIYCGFSAIVIRDMVFVNSLFKKTFWLAGQ
jgi:hypothetical protein